MKQLIEYIVKGIVDEPDAVRITEQQTRGRKVFEVEVADPDIGKVIGKNGRVANAMRHIIDRCRADDNDRDRTVKIIS